MKNSVYFRCLWPALIGLLGLFTACKQEKPLKLQGVWDEESYWTPNDSIEADTLIHTYTLRHIRFDCDFSFRMAQTTYHHAIPGDPALGSDTYTEYIQGSYTVGNTMVLDGRYYTDDTYSVEADSLNTRYSYGPYNMTLSYKLDAKRLVLGATEEQLSSSTHVFAQTEAIECY